MWGKVKSLLSFSAPLVGGLIGGPAGATVSALVANTLGVENSPSAIEKKLRNNPDALIKIKKMESDERIELRRLMLKEADIQLDKNKALLLDVQHARNQQREHWMPWVLTLTLAVMVFAMFVGLFFGKPSLEFSQVLIMIAGTLLGSFSSGVAFWLGSSQGSVVKSQQLFGKETNS